MSAPTKGMIQWHYNEDTWDSELPLQGDHQAGLRDPVIAAIGKFGRWQLTSFLLLGTFYMTSSWSVIVMAFLNAETEFTCHEEEFFFANESIEQENEEDSPILMDSFSRCFVGDVTCKRFKFSVGINENSLTSEFSLVCNRQYLKGLAQSVFFLGQLTGIILFGILSEKFGRKMVFVPTIVLAGLCDLCSAVIPSFEAFVAFRFFTASLKIGAYEAMFSWLLESVSGKWTMVIALGFFLFWVAAWMILTPLAYFVRNWRYLIAIIAVPNILAFGLYWAVPESPKWLLAQGRRAQAELAVSKIVRINKREGKLPTGWTLQVSPVKDAEIKQKNKAKSVSLWDLFRYSELRKKTFILFFIWFSVSSAYYFFSLTTDFLGGGNLFVNQLFSGFVEIPGYVGAIAVTNWKGRKYIFGFALGLAGVLSLIIIGVAPMVHPSGWAIVVLMCLIKAVITLGFSLAYVISVEVFPSVLHSISIAAASCVARIGAVATPWIAMTDRFYQHLPLIIFGVFSIISGILALVLPETSKAPETIDESEDLKVEMPFCGYTEQPRSRSK